MGLMDANLFAHVAGDAVEMAGYASLCIQMLQRSTCPLSAISSDWLHMFSQINQPSQGTMDMIQKTDLFFILDSPQLTLLKHNIGLRYPRY